MGLEHTLVPAAGTSEDVAMLMAYEKGAALIVSVGAHFNLIEFLDRKRGGMSSTFLTRLRIGEKLVDAKGVSRLYTPSSPFGPGRPLPRRLRDPADDPGHHLAGAQRPRPACLAEDQDLARALAGLGGGPSSLRPPMGYSARYHATSLIAVFIALAIGILIGAEFGGDAVTNTRKDLEHSLTGNLQDARARADQLNGPSWAAPTSSPNASTRRWSATGWPASGSGSSRSAGCRAKSPRTSRTRWGRPGRGWSGSGWCGSRSTFTRSRASSRRRASPTSGATPTRSRPSAPGWGASSSAAGTLLERVRSQVFSRASGNFGALDGVIVVRDQPEDMGPVQRATAGRLESALMGGVTGTRTPAVGVETSTAEPSSVSFFQGNDLSSVDDVDATAGRVAMVFAMLGAEGSFGVKGSADRLLPDLLAPGR